MFDYRLRESAENIRKEALEILRSPFFNRLLEEVPSMIIIMNKNRQIIYMNRRFSETADSMPPNDITGSRPGECLLCIHASEGRFGCGSTDFCKVCGFAKSIEKSEKGFKASGECNITLKKGETLTFSVRTRPFDHKGKRYIFSYMQDISDLKTRQMLENIFLHDIYNSITALNGLSELIDDLPANETKNIINDLSLRLTDEIHSYRLISEAENHLLSVRVSNVDIDSLIKGVTRSLLNIKHLRNRTVRHVESGIVINTDETLLRRVLINTIKNALEASADEHEISIFSVNGKEDYVNINVRSQPLIPKDVQLQLFQRAFSTKGSGRGWGTYSIRLLTEKYLGGKVEFISDKKRRTVFTISLPPVLYTNEGFTGKKLRE